MQPKDVEKWGKVRGGKQDETFLEAPGKLFHSLYRTAGIATEFFRGMHTFRNEFPCVTVFGSARFPEGHKYYELARETGRHLAEAGLTVMTGGGPGTMEAANRGAREASGRSIGCNIKLPMEQHPNPYLDEWITFRHFFFRKVMLIKYSCAFIVLPGGFGTLDEVFETATLIQTGTIQQFPIVMLGNDYWEELDDFVKKALLGHETISPEDAAIFHYTDSPADALEYIRKMRQKVVTL